MGQTKKNFFTEEQNQMAAMAKALGHPARIAIMQYLIKKGSCVCGDIVEELPLAQSTVSQHLKEMKKVGLIRGDVEGTFTCYCVDAQCCMDVKAAFNRLFDSLKSCC